MSTRGRDLARSWPDPYPPPPSDAVNEQRQRYEANDKACDPGDAAPRSGASGRTGRHRGSSTSVHLPRRSRDTPRTRSHREPGRERHRLRYSEWHLPSRRPGEQGPGRQDHHQLERRRAVFRRPELLRCGPRGRALRAGGVGEPLDERIPRWELSSLRSSIPPADGRHSGAFSGMGGGGPSADRRSDSRSTRSVL